MTNEKSFPKGTLVLFLSVIVLLALAALTLRPSSKPIPAELLATLRPQAVPVQPFTLVDQNDQLYKTERLRGKWSFVFFGYTSCPHICPTTLATLTQVTKKLGETPGATENVQVLLVSVDPDRDKPEVLNRYLKNFNASFDGHRKFTGLTGLRDDLIRFAKQFGATYIKDEGKEAGQYDFSHTSSIFLVDPQVRIIAAFSPPHDAQTIASQYLKIRELFQ